MTRATPKPPWLKRPLAGLGQTPAVKGVLEALGLHTVCEQARCPNRGECFERGEAVFLLLGPSCTRDCAFCAVEHAPPAPPDESEPQRTAQAAAALGLEYCVLTMVTRDDLPDGGAAHVAATINALKKRKPSLAVEALISDLAGDPQALATVLAAEPQVLNHNLETAPRLYPQVRPQAQYRRSLNLLQQAAQQGALTKSGLMLGLGERRSEVLAVMRDLRDVGCRLLTLGQYLAPSPRHHPIVRYLEPAEFQDLRAQALDMGFAAAASGPYVRSSYKGAELAGGGGVLAAERIVRGSGEK